MMRACFSSLSGKQPPERTERELEEEIREVVTEGQREGLIEEEAREMIESVMTLGEVSVSEIMTPRTEMISMAVDVDWDEALQLVTKSGHTRIPVYGERRDEIIGILHIKDMLNEMVRTPGGKPAADGRVAAAAVFCARDQTGRRFAARISAKPQSSGGGDGRVRRRVGLGDD